MASESLAVQPATESAHCEQHGAYERNVIEILGRTMRGGCQQCAAEERQRQDERERAEVARREQAELAKRLDSALIPYRFQDRAFDGYTAKTPAQKKALSVCRDYADRFREHHAAGRCLILSGKPGTGKTHLAVAIANQLLHTTGAVCVYRTVGAMLSYIKGSYDGNEYSEADAIKSLVSPHLLILDEIGATKPSEFELAMLFNVINGRYEQQLPTIIISNLPPAEIGAAMGERCLDRLREGGGIAVAFDWESMRREIKA